MHWSAQDSFLTRSIAKMNIQFETTIRQPLSVSHWEQFMTPRMYFTLVLRGIGIWNFIEGLDHFVTAFNVHKGLYTPSLTDSQAFVTHGSLHLVVGIVLLAGAATISALLVPAMQSPVQDNQETGKSDA
jgi:hypothetical protein